MTRSVLLFCHSLDDPVALGYIRDIPALLLLSSGIQFCVSSSDSISEDLFVHVTTRAERKFL